MTVHEKQIESPRVAELPRLTDFPHLAVLLLAWYDRGRRILPWREDPTPYHVWVSEIMLQQTRVEAVKPYYDRFLQQLPDIPALAAAEEEQLLKLWEGLGYYNRVRNLQKAAQMVMQQFDGRMPQTVPELLQLPGIGSYTAGAIASIACGMAEPAVDGNVLRVFSRVRTDSRDIADQKVKKAVEAEVREIMPQKRPGDFNQALMELGACVCLPNGQPKCESCPLQGLCCAYRDGCMTQFPVKSPKKPRRIEEKTVLLLMDDVRVAMQRRSEKGLLAGMYEFPGLPGLCNQETVLDFVKQLGFAPLHIRPLGSAKHVFTHIEWHMLGYAIRVDELFPVAETAKKLHYMFIEKNEIEEKYPVPSAYAAYAAYLQITPGLSQNTRFRKERREFPTIL